MGEFNAVSAKMSKMTSEFLTDEDYINMSRFQTVSAKFSEIMASADEEVKKRQEEIQNELSQIDENFRLQKKELVEEAFKKFILKG